MNRQIKQCRFNLLFNNGSSITQVSGFPVTISLSSGFYTFSPYYYTGSAYDEALDGSLRSQLGGYRFEAELLWDRLVDSQPLLNLLNGAYTSSTGQIIIEFYPDATDNSIYENVIISNSSWKSSIESTLIRQPLTISLIGKVVRPTIPQYYLLGTGTPPPTTAPPPTTTTTSSGTTTTTTAGTTTTTTAGTTTTTTVGTTTTTTVGTTTTSALFAFSVSINGISGVNACGGSLSHTVYGNNANFFDCTIFYNNSSGTQTIDQAFGLPLGLSNNISYHDIGTGGVSTNKGLC